jgi:glycogen operon protein
VREQQKRNMLATLFLSQGTPMIQAGDEHGNTQKGNNNAYAQDNAIGWLDWDSITEEGKKLTGFVKKLIQFRKDHAVLRAPEFMHGQKVDAQDVKDVTWLNPAGREQTAKDWGNTQDRSIGVLFNERAALGNKKGERLLTLFNAHSGDVDFKLPAVKGGKGWTRVLDTSDPEMQDDKTAMPTSRPINCPRGRLSSSSRTDYFFKA